MLKNFVLNTRQLLSASFQDDWFEKGDDLGGKSGFIQFHVSKPIVLDSAIDQTVVLKFEGSITASVSMNNDAQSFEDQDKLDRLFEIKTEFAMIYYVQSEEAIDEDFINDDSNYWFFEKDASMFLSKCSEDLLKNTAHQYAKLPVQTHTAN